MKKKRKLNKPVVLFQKKDLEYYQQNFKHKCEKCGEILTVIKHRPKTHGHDEVVAATCFNKDFKGKGFKCDQYCVEIRFIERFI